MHIPRTANLYHAQLLATHLTHLVIEFQSCSLSRETKKGAWESLGSPCPYSTNNKPFISTIATPELAHRVCVGQTSLHGESELQTRTPKISKPQDDLKTNKNPPDSILEKRAERKEMVIIVFQVSGHKPSLGS